MIGKSRFCFYHSSETLNLGFFLIIICQLIVEANPLFSHRALSLIYRYVSDQNHVPPLQPNAMLSWDGD